jgi:hypothetical protein
LDSVVADRFTVLDDVPVPDTWSQVQFKLLDPTPVQWTGAEPTLVDLVAPSPTDEGRQRGRWVLAAAAYRTWACEPEAHPARPAGAHCEHRICSTDLLSTSQTGRDPGGAASVKALVRDGQVTGFAVMRKLADTGSAGDWFWYEAYGDGVIAEGRTPSICTGCHSGAPRDFIFTRVE